MIFNVGFKTPDAMDTAINEAVVTQFGMSYEEIEEEYLNPNTEHERMIELEKMRDDASELMDSVRKVMGRFCTYGEYVIIEFDTETQTAKVVE